MRSSNSHNSILFARYISLACLSASVLVGPGGLALAADVADTSSDEIGSIVITDTKTTRSSVDIGATELQAYPARRQPAEGD